MTKIAGYLENGNRNGETIAAAISESTAFVDTIAPILATDELSLGQFAKEGGIVIVEIEEADYRILREFVTLFTGNLLASLQRVAGANPTGRLAHKTNIIFDELAAAGPVPGIADALHTCRERDYHFIAACQSITQISAIYKDEADNVLSGFQSHVALPGALDPVSAAYYSVRSGTTTVLAPQSLRGGSNDGIPEVKSWQYIPRQLFLPSDIASPHVHSVLGSPATLFLGGLAPFQAFLTPAYEHGCFGRLFEEVDLLQSDDDLRPIPLSILKSATEFGVPPKNANGGFAEAEGWTNSQIRERVEQLKDVLDWRNCSEESRSWWNEFEAEYADSMGIVLRFLEELFNRGATIDEYYQIHKGANTDNIGASLHYFDYVKARKEERNRKVEAYAMSEASTLRFMTGDECPQNAGGRYIFDGFVNSTASPLPSKKHRAIRVVPGFLFPAVNPFRLSCWWRLESADVPF